MNHEKTLEQTIEELQQRLAEQEQEFAYRQALMLTLANSAYEALMVINEKHQIIAINDSAAELFQHQKPIGENMTDVTGSPELETMVNDALTNREEVFEEQLTIDKRVYRARTQVIQRDGNLFIGVALQDISELVRLNRARRDMVANISHELRTPIANIRLIIDGLFHEHEKPKRKQSISSLRAIARETDALLWMAQELLDLSMIESGQAIMRMVEVRAHELVDEAIEYIYDQSAAKELEIVHDIPKDMLVLCDHDKVQRVLVNLIHNAVKWSPPGETIMVQAKDTGDEVTFSVIDNGPGVPDEYKERIFERFYQVDPSRSGNEGTGLGLAICKHIIEAHEGRIWAEGNGKRKGGRFFFTLLKPE
jgi:two-component system, OmpR family, phosphate regulon sensor histidine kinase PhoR